MRAHVFDLVAKHAAQLPAGVLQPHIALRPNDVNNRLSLRQGQPPVKESSLREFARLRQASAFSQQYFQHASGNERPTVNRKLDHVFACKGTRTTKVGEQALVKRLSILADHFSKVDAPRLHPERLARAPKHLFGNPERTLPA